jgi:type I restriction enzyme S subunit
MKPYPAYKNSGIEWLGEIPAHWKVAQLKHLCKRVTDGSHFSPETQEKGFPYITVQNIRENDIDFENCKRISEDNYLALKKAGNQPKQGDILLTKDGTIGKAVIIKEQKDFVILSSLGLITPNQQEITSDYLRFYLISGINVDQMFSFIHGSALTRLTIKLIKELLIVSPPLPEQRAIAAYLDHKTRLIDTYVAKKQQQIERLQAYRTALINQAVTKGLNPDAPMKDSGIAWLGEIPAHWEVKKTKYLFFLSTEKAPKNNDYELLSLYTDIGVKPRKELEQRGNKATTTDDYFIVKKGDIVVYCEKGRYRCKQTIGMDGGFGNVRI